jgi:hypothetical protein
MLIEFGDAFSRIVMPRESEASSISFSRLIIDVGDYWIIRFRG